MTKQNILLSHKVILWTCLLIIFILCMYSAVHYFYAFLFTQKQEYIDTLLLNAREQLFSGYPQDAADYYLKRLSIKKDDPQALLELAIVYDDYLDKDEEAVGLYKQFTEVATDKETVQMVKEWMQKTASQSLGDDTEKRRKYKYNQMKQLIEEYDKENEMLKEQVEHLSSKLYTLEEKHQKEIVQIQAEREQLASEVSSARLRIGKLLTALKQLEEKNKQLTTQKNTLDTWDDPVTINNN